MLAQNLRYEAEWLSTNIISLFQALSTERFYQQKSKQFLSLQVLTTLKPIIVRSSTVEVPRHWKNDQLVQSSRFHLEQSAWLSQSSRSPQNVRPSKPHSEDVPMRRNASVITLQKDLSASKKTNLLVDNPTPPKEVSPNLLSKFSSHSKSNQFSQTVPIKSQKHSSYQESVISGSTLLAAADSRSKSSPLNEHKPFPHQFARLWTCEALVRLDLSESAAAQINRLHIIVTHCHAKKSLTHLNQEKALIKSELKQFDRQFYDMYKRWPTREEKEPLRSLYTYYRRVKMSIEHLMPSFPKNTNDDTKHLSLEHIPEQEKKEEVVSNKEIPYKPDRTIADDEACLARMQMEKAQIRSKLQEYQRTFYKQEGRLLKYHRDIMSVEQEYRQYKILREKIVELTQQLKLRKGQKT